MKSAEIACTRNVKRKFIRNLPKSKPIVKGLVTRPLPTFSILMLRIMTNGLAANGNHQPKINLLATEMLNLLTKSEPGDSR